MRAKDVRFYKERGLLQRARRHPGWTGETAYHQEHVDRLKFVSRALILGFSLDAIARLVDASTLTTCKDVYELADTQLERIRSLLGDDAPSAAVLRNLMDSCTKNGGRDDCRIYIALAQPAGRPA
jgi:MerR family mercuric resistance operon transcriptional regulator